MSDIVGGRHTSPRRRETPQFANGKRSLTANLYSKKSFAYRYRGGGRECLNTIWGMLPVLSLAEADDLNFAVPSHYQELMNMSAWSWRKLRLVPCAAIRDNHRGAVLLYPTHLPIPAVLYPTQPADPAEIY